MEDDIRECSQCGEALPDEQFRVDDCKKCHGSGLESVERGNECCCCDGTGVTKQCPVCGETEGRTFSAEEYNERERERAASREDD
jgi:RecJ-like exonuclease